MRHYVPKDNGFVVIEYPDPYQPSMAECLEQLEESILCAFIPQANALVKSINKLYKVIRKVRGAPWRYRTPSSLRPSNGPYNKTGYQLERREDGFAITVGLMEYISGWSALEILYWLHEKQAIPQS